MFDRDDILYDDDERNTSEDWEFEHNEFDQAQALISEKKVSSAFSVERNIINSKSYHDKFEKLPVSKVIQECIYKEVGRLLEYTDCLDEERMEQERMSVLDYHSGTIILDNFKRSGDVYKTGLTTDEYEKIITNPNSVIVIHNHSHNGRPSGKDLLTFLKEEKIKLSIVACHNGDLYAIYWVKVEFQQFYEEVLNSYKKVTNDIDEAQKLALTYTYQYNSAMSDRHKLFKVAKL